MFERGRLVLEDALALVSVVGEETALLTRSMEAVLRAARAEVANPTWQRPGSGPGSRKGSVEPRLLLDPIPSLGGGLFEGAGEDDRSGGPRLSPAQPASPSSHVSRGRRPGSGASVLMHPGRVVPLAQVASPRRLLAPRRRRPKEEEGGSSSEGETPSLASADSRGRSFSPHVAAFGEEVCDDGASEGTGELDAALEAVEAELAEHQQTLHDLEGREGELISQLHGSLRGAEALLRTVGKLETRISQATDEAVAPYRTPRAAGSAAAAHSGRQGQPPPSLEELVGRWSRGALGFPLVVAEAPLFDSSWPAEASSEAPVVVAKENIFFAVAALPQAVADAAGGCGDLVDAERLRARRAMGLAPCPEE